MTEKRRPPIHPGVHLAEFLEEYELSQYALAKAMHVPPRRINEIVKGQRGVTADTSIRLGKVFSQSSRFWLNLQTRYDLEVAERSFADEIDPLVATV